jgi:hypothetical protein
LEVAETKAPTFAPSPRPRKPNRFFYVDSEALGA